MLKIVAENYIFLPLSGGWEVGHVKPEIYEKFLASNVNDFKVLYSPVAQKTFGYIHDELETITRDKTTRFFKVPRADHFLGLLLGWSMVDDEGDTWIVATGEEDPSWVSLEDNCWHGDIDSVILNLVMPKDGGGACGCGSNHDAVVALNKFIGTQMNNPLVTDDAVRKQNLEETIYRDDLLGQAFWFIAYVLDAAGFTEHGSGIRHGWLTDKGPILALLIGESMKQATAN